MSDMNYYPFDKVPCNPEARLFLKTIILALNPILWSKYATFRHPFSYDCFH